jgi:organic radical activating enzyme
MIFPWNEYEELETKRKNTLQIFITTRCQLHCKGCFARNIMNNNQDISIQEYTKVIEDFKNKNGEQINLIGGEPLLHPNITDFIDMNNLSNIKTTIYTNGLLLDKFSNLKNAKIRVSIYCKSGNLKSIDKFPITNKKLDFCFMIKKSTTIKELLDTANIVESKYNSNVFFISSIRELDNPRKEFFDDTKITMNLLKYKELVHNFLNKYKGNMEIHISKRGMFESSLISADNKCRFANYFIGGKIIQCPYDIINKFFQNDYSFNKRYCQQNSSCLMSKIIIKRKHKAK